MKKLSFCQKGFITVGTILILVISFPFSSSIIIKQTTTNLIYSQVTDIPQKSTALVLGAAAYPSRLSDILQDRVDTAIELYKAKKVQTIIMSGDANEAKRMAEYALKKGVDKNDLIQDSKGLNTFASVENAKSFKSLVIVTQKYHLPRALFIAKYFNIDVVGLASDKRTYTNMFTYQKRELLATSKAMLDIIRLKLSFLNFF